MQTPFIKKIKQIMEKPEYQDIICWTKGNTAIEIRDEKLFEQKILPIHFRHNKMPSFIRQLNLYGFKKIRSAAHQTFTHTAFEEGKGLETILSQRKKIQTPHRYEVPDRPERHQLVIQNQAFRVLPLQNQRRDEKTVEIPRTENPRREQDGIYCAPVGHPSPMWPMDMRNYYMMTPPNVYLPPSPYNYYGNWGL